MELNNDEKMFILYCKGRFSNYKNAKEVILAEAYALHEKDINEGNSTSYAIGLFCKLVDNGFIKPAGTKSPIEWLMGEINEYLYRQKDFNLFNWIKAEIQWSVMEGLLDDVDRSIESEMKLREGEGNDIWGKTN